jgi:hypothetical protein
MNSLQLGFEREFLHLASSMLRCRFHILHGRTCTRVGWIQYTDKPIDGILCYVGYSDFKAEMRLVCREMAGSGRRLRVGGGTSDTTQALTNA